MFDYSDHGPVFAKAILILAAASLLLAIIFGFPIVEFFENPVGLICLVILVFGGMVFAGALSFIAGEVLPRSSTPWYASLDGLCLLVFALVAFNGFLWFAYQWILNAPWLNEAFPPLSRIFAALTAELLWILRLDWPEETDESESWISSGRISSAVKKIARPFSYSSSKSRIRTTPRRPLAEPRKL